MEDCGSKPFFRNLKETVSIINEVVSKVTAASSEIPSECNYSERHEYFEKKFNDIKQTKEEAIRINKELNSKITYFQNFFHDFQDLVLEVEENVNSQEKYLKKFGYKPLEAVTIVESPVSKTPPLEEKIRENSKTPSIYDFIDPGQINIIKRQTNSANKNDENTNVISELQSSDGTPKLILNQNFNKRDYLENEVSTTDEMDCIAKGIKELPPVTPPFRVENSVIAGDSTCEISYSDISLNKISRKLSF